MLNEQTIFQMGKLHIIFFLSEKIGFNIYKPIPSIN